jgi:hypothetical protein
MRKCSTTAKIHDFISKRQLSSFTELDKLEAMLWPLEDVPLSNIDIAMAVEGYTMTDDGEKSSKGLDVASNLAVDRTRLAHERTMLAWVRTATSLITFGFGIQ